MYIVGLTGGIGCGKSTIEKYFKDLNVPIIDTDVISHQLQQPGETGYVFIKQLFGDAIVDFDGSLNRDRLRSIVFNDPEAKAKLESLMSPLIYHEVKNQIKFFDSCVEQEPAWPDYIILTVPLLIPKYNNTGSNKVSKIFQDLVNRILVIDCPEETQIERVMARSKLQRKMVEKIINSQSERLLRIMKADDLIHNFDCAPEDNLPVVKELHERYIQLAKNIKTQ